MHHRGLALTLAAIVSATVVACGGAEDAPLGPVTATPTVAPGFTGIPARDASSSFALLPLGQTFDGAVMRLVMSGTAGSAAPTCSASTRHPRELSSVTIGQPCGKASDAAKCAAELACIVGEAGLPGGGGQIPSYYVFVFAKDGALTTVTTRPELLKWLGGIDVVEKAIFLAAFDLGARVRVTGHRAAASGGFDVQVRGGGACSGEATYDAIVHVSVDGVVTEIDRRTDTQPIPACAEGRRPAGLLAGPSGGIGAGVADYLAEAAHLEAAAVLAFDQMATRLRAAGAPAHLVAAADRAREDEIRHARAMGALARIHGREPVAPRLGDPGDQSLEALAVENAVEGCVRETYAVLRAMWQAKHASDPRIRAALAVVAREEAQHAELSWELDAWLSSRLDARARRRVAEARAQALASLREELHGAPHPEVVRVAGMPTVRVALALFEGLSARVEASVPPHDGCAARSGREVSARV